MYDKITDFSEKFWLISMIGMDGYVYIRFATDIMPIKEDFDIFGIENEYINVCQIDKFHTWRR